MVQELEILKGYITCEDAATRNKFFNLLDSFWHKKDGKILKETVIGQDGSTTFRFLDDAGNISEVSLPALPNSKPISFISGLQTKLDALQPKVLGKGLSTNDFTTTLLNKLNSLENYVHPEYHQIAEIFGLTEALEGKQPLAPEGYGFSQANFTQGEKDKLAKYNLSHYGNPVADLNALAAIPATEYTNDQRHYVSSEGCDYFYDADAVAGDLAPADQVNGTGFWMKGITANEIIDNLTSNDASAALSANQGRILKGLIDGNLAKFADYILLTEKGTANGVAILDSNGKIVDSQLGDLAITDTVIAAETTLANFTAAVAADPNLYNFQKGDIIVIDDGTGNLSHYLFKGGDQTAEASYSQLNATKLPISAIIGLQAALDGKVSKTGDETIAGKKTFSESPVVPVPVNDDQAASKVYVDGTLLTRTVISGTNPVVNNTEKFPELFHYEGGNGVEISIANLVAGDVRLRSDMTLPIVCDAKYELVVPEGFSPTIKKGGIVFINRRYTVDSGTGKEKIYISGALVATTVAGPKPTKLINNSTQYTAVLEDKNYFLVFTNPIDFIIPSGIFAADDELDGRNKSSGDVTVVAGSGMTVDVVSSQTKKAPQYAFFGLRFESASRSGLLGQLKPI